jgi:hypothetical protein
MEPPLPRANYTSAADSLVLEDESGRVALTAGHWHPVRHGGVTRRLPAAFCDPVTGKPRAIPVPLQR